MATIDGNTMLNKDLQMDSEKGRSGNTKIEQAMKKAVTTKLTSIAGDDGRQLITKDASGIRSALDYLGIRARLNTRSGQEEVLVPVEGTRPGLETFGIDHRDQWVGVERDFVIPLRQALATNFVAYTRDAKKRAAKFPTLSVREGVYYAAYKNRVDPFAEWIRSLPEWDGTERLETWLWQECVTLKEPSENNRRVARWCSRHIPYLAIWRTFEDRQVKADEHVVLVGDQECGKSTLLKHLLPGNMRDAHFSDGFSFTLGDKEMMELLARPVIVEMAEMVGSSKAAIERMKRVLSSTDDGIARPAYGYAVKSQPRKCVLVGSANPGNVLPNDPTGLRRFVPLDVKLIDGGVTRLRRYLSQHRDQIWAEAYALYDGGKGPKTYYLPAELKTTAATVAETHRSRDAILEDRVSEFTNGGALTGFTTAECASECKLGTLAVQGRMDWRVAAVLRARGYEVKRARNGKAWRREWHSPALETETYVPTPVNEYEGFAQ